MDQKSHYFDNKLNQIFSKKVNEVGRFKAFEVIIKYKRKLNSLKPLKVASE